MSLLELYRLKSNPFTIVPSRSNLIWAGREKFKTEIEDAIKFTLYGSQSQIIACIYGDWGCGKTHAMCYFSSEPILKKLAQDVGLPKDRTPLAIPLLFPTKDVFRSLYLDIVYHALFPKLEEIIKFVAKQTSPLLTEGHVEKKLKDLGLKDDVAKVLAQFNDKGKSVVVGRYLSGNASRSDLQKLGVAKGIEIDGERLSILTDILKLLTNTVHSRIFIWIDDCERISDIPGKEMFEFQYFLRDILDLTPEKLTIIINFTLLPGSDVPERMTFLGPAVQNRIAKTIRVGYFDTKDYLKYVEDLLKYYRIDPKETDKYFPFNEAALLQLFKTLEKSTLNLQPRTINRVLSALLEKGIREKSPSLFEPFLESAKEEIKLAMST